MRFSLVLLAFSGGALALPALHGVAAHPSTELVDRSSGIEIVSLANGPSRHGFTAEAMPASEDANAKRRSLRVVPRRKKKKGGAAAGTDTDGSPRSKTIGDNKVNPTTGLTDSQAAEIVTGLDLTDKKAPGSINSKGQRNPLPGLNADETDAIVKQGQAALKEAGALKVSRL